MNHPLTPSHLSSCAALRRAALPSALASASLWLLACAASPEQVERLLYQQSENRAQLIEQCDLTTAQHIRTLRDQILSESERERLNQLIEERFADPTFQSCYRLAVENQRQRLHIQRLQRDTNWNSFYFDRGFYPFYGFYSHPRYYRYPRYYYYDRDRDRDHRPQLPVRPSAPAISNPAGTFTPRPSAPAISAPPSAPSTPVSSPAISNSAGVFQ